MSIQQMLLGASGASGYLIDKSLRFRASASAYLNRTPASAGNLQTWTWSGWVKRGTFGSEQRLFASSDLVSLEGFLQFNTNNTFTYSDINTLALTTTQVFRDPSAWYHIVVALDTTQAIASNRVKIYVNGSQVTAFTSALYPAQNSNEFLNRAVATRIGSALGNNLYFDGYLADVYFVDGQALTPASFGETDSTTGVWKPKRYAGTYGTNGFALDFEDTSTVAALGTDTSGNGNTWTVNNISLTAGVTYDSMTDVPTLTNATTANYAVLNPLDNTLVLSNANLYAQETTSGAYGGARATIAIPTSGKWYFEYVIANAPLAARITTGLSTSASNLNAAMTNISTSVSYDTRYSTSRAIYNQTTLVRNDAAIAFTTNDIVQCAFDVATGKLWFGKNNSWFDASSGTTGDPSAGTNQTLTVSLAGPLFPFVSSYFEAGEGGGAASINFGQRPFAFSPPTGFVALNTFNLPTSTIVKGNTVMDATLYTGNGSTQTITNAAGFQPDLVWVKSRSVARDHRLVDSVRGATKNVRSNTSNAEDTETDGLVSFNSNGFGVGANTGFNENAATLVGWQWKGGGAAVSNTNGSITSSVSVNPNAGFSVVTYTGTGANATVGHGLGVAPKMIIVKQRSSTASWRVYHASIGNGNALYLNLTDASTAEATAWNSTTPTSSVFSVGTSAGTNANTATYVAYCWSEIDGYSKFGGYTGNGSTDGAFIYTGFRPRFVLVRQTNGAGNWLIWDTARSTYNQMQLYLSPNNSSQELNNAVVSIDSVSNGFKCRTSDNDINGSGDTYIYMAFAESPFKQSLAR